MLAPATPAPTPITPDFLAQVQAFALQRLLHLAAKSASEREARLACCALLRFRLPDPPEEPEPIDQPPTDDFDIDADLGPQPEDTTAPLTELEKDYLRKAYAPTHLPNLEDPSMAQTFRYCITNIRTNPINRPDPRHPAARRDSPSRASPRMHIHEP